MLRVALVLFVACIGTCQVAALPSSGPPHAAVVKPVKQYNTSAGSCSSDRSCPVGQYCNSRGSCYSCSYITKETCDDKAGKGTCCSATFRAQCTTNPHGCGVGGGCFQGASSQKTWSTLYGVWCASGYTGGASAAFEISYRSLNSDSITAYAQWAPSRSAIHCTALPGSGDWSVMGRSTSSSGTVTFNERLTNTVYKTNNPCITLKCTNTFQDCSIDLKGLMISPMTADGVDLDDAVRMKPGVFTIPAGESVAI